MGKLLDRKTSASVIPPLVEGDRLGLDEFWRRYEADPEVVRAELLDGVVYVNARRVDVDGKEMIVPPISQEGHGRPQNRVSTWLGFYAASTKGVVASAPYSVRMSNRTVPEPDALLEILPEFKDQSVSINDPLLDAVPELVVEIANTSVDRDLGPKYQAYQAARVKEYLVWQTQAGIVDWFVLKRKKFLPIQPDEQGIFRSETFSGLWLDVAALLEGETGKVLDILQLGLASPEHAAFVAKLRAKARRK